MKLKLDENIGRRGLELTRAAGHDVLTVRDQGLQGASDDELFRACTDEARVLVTLDHDFGHLLRFPLENSAGVVILEIGQSPVLKALLGRLADFLNLLKTEPVRGTLWIVEAGRVRIRRHDP